MDIIPVYEEEELIFLIVGNEDDAHIIDSKDALAYMSTHPDFIVFEMNGKLYALYADQSLLIDEGAAMDLPEEVREEAAAFAEARSREIARANMDEASLTDEEIRLTHRVAEIINAQIAVPCTGCAYCTEGCPMNIPIPKYFSLYNEDMREDLAQKGWTVNYSNYGNLAESFGKAADCIACGQCEGVCPQHLPIIDLMKKVSAHFDH